MFDPQPFNALSPWKYDSNMFPLSAAGMSQANFNIRTPIMIKQSPMKSPVKGFTSQWALMSPMVEDRGDS